MSIQGCLNCRKLNDGKRYMYVSDEKIVEVEAIRKYRLLVNTIFFLDLDETFSVPSFRRNLIYIFTLDKYGYSYLFINEKFSIFHDSKLVGFGSLSSNDSLYLLDIITSFNESLQFSTRDLKSKLTNDNSAALWHMKLGHISIRRIEKLMLDGILDLLDLINLNICVNCIKGK